MSYVLVDNTGNTSHKRGSSKQYNYFFALSLFPTCELQNVLRLLSAEDAILCCMDVLLLKMAFCMH